MRQTAKAVFKAEGWNETVIGNEDTFPRLSRSNCRQQYLGEIVAESILEYLMTHCEDGTVSFVGMEQVTGSFNGKQGSFAIQHRGTFDSGIAKIQLEIVSNSGTGELKNLTGLAYFESPHAEEYEVEFSFDFV